MDGVVVTQAALFRVRASPMAHEAAAELRRTLPTLWPVWTLGFLLTALVYGIAVFHRHAVADGVSLSRLAMVTAACVVGALVTTLAMPTLLRLDGGPWRLDTRRLCYLTLQAALNTSVNALIELIVETAGPGPWATGAATVAAVGFWLWLSLRMSLWPIGVLTGDVRLTLWRSWAATRGVMSPYLLAIAVGELPAYLIASLFVGWFLQTGVILYVGIGALALIASDAWVCAVAVAFLRHRLGLHQAEQAAVFD